MAIKGVALIRSGGPAHIVSAVTEHPAVLNSLTYLHSRFGTEVTLLPVDGYGRVDPAGVEVAIRPHTFLVSLMHANDEVGTLNDLETIGEITRRRGILFHVDAAQSAGKFPIDVDAMHIDLLTIAGHKLYAPKGIGALYIRSGVQIGPAGPRCLPGKRAAGRHRECCLHRCPGCGSTAGARTAGRGNRPDVGTPQRAPTADWHRPFRIWH